LPAGTAGQAYSSALTPATGGIAPYTYAVTAGALPAGITLNGSSGALTGTPGNVGSFSFNVTATDSTSGTPSQATQSYSLNIAAPPIVVAPSTLPAATRGTAYSQALSASGGTAPYTYALASGTLPAGITLASNGTLSGTATVNGSFNFTVTANDAGGFSGSQAYVLTVGAPTVLVAPATLPNPTVGTAYSQTVSASGGTAPYTFAVTAGATPAGLSFSAAGVLSGTPTASGTFNFTVTATDGNGFDGARAYTVTVGAPTLVLTPASQPAAHVDQAYSASFSTSGGTAPYHYTVTGSLPTGLSLADNGTLSGTPTQAGNFPVAIHVTDSSSGAGSPFTATVNLTLTVDADPLVLTPAGSALTATYGASNSIAFASSGGSAPRTLSLAGALPAGMSFDAASGVLSGTPTVIGSFAFTVTVTDASVSPATLSRNYTLTIAAVTVVVSPTTLPAATVGTAYSGTLGASGGVGPYTFAVSAGALPQGITLSGSGALSGTPTQSGPATFTIRASDVNGMSGDQAYSVTVGEAAPVAVSDAAQTPANQAVIIPVTANDTGVMTSVAVAASPTHGATVVEGTSVRYTPTADFFGTDVFTYTAIGPGGRSNAATVTVTVQAGAVPVAQDQSVTTLAGQTVRIDAANGASGGPFTALALATTPAVGTATVDGTTIIYAAPADASGTQRFTYTLSNAFGASQPATVSVTINPMPVAPPVSAAAVSGRNVRVNISAGASGGPFTGADVISVAPASAGQASVERSADGYAVVFDAAPAFVGLAQISYTLTNAYATSAPGVLSVSVAARPDPSKDPEVLGVLSAQADATRRMAVGQINNFQRRLEQLHNGQPAVGFSNGITLSSASANAATAMNERNRDHGPSAIQDLSATSSNMLADQNMVAPNGNTAGLLPGGASVWTGGVVNFGKAGSTRGDTSTDFTTSGVSMGADKLFADGLIIGAGVGYGRDDTDVGNDASSSKVDSYSAAVYASYRPTEAFFIDSLLGYQWLSLDSVRSVTDTGGRVVGNRDGKQWFGSLSMGYILRSRDIQLTPYGRFDAAQASLDGFTERGDDLYALRYQAQTVKTNTASAGVLAQFAIKRDYGVWAPQLRAEYGRDLEGSSSALMSYADLVGSNPYRASLLQRSRDHALLGGGFSLQTLGGWNFTAEYQVQLESDTGNNQSVRFGIEKKFDH
jgi:outer membrane autotransporter protein